MTDSLPNIVAQAYDMHIHSNFSDAQMGVDQIESVCLEKQIGCCVADHNEIRGSIRLFEKGKTPTIPAIEAGSKERLEFIFYFPTPDKLEDYYVHYVEPFKKKRYFAKLDISFLDLAPAAKDYGALVCLPHPFAPGWKGLNYRKSRKAKLLDPHFIKNVDLIEVINGHLPDSRNFKAFLLSELFDKSVSAGSDAHTLDEIGEVYLQFQQPRTPREVYEILKSPLKVGKNKPFSPGGFMRAGRKVALKHLKLFTSPKNHRAWMVKYDLKDRQ